MGLFGKLFGSDNDRQIKKIEVIAAKVEALADLYAGMTDKELCNCTKEFKIRLSKGETLDDILPDAFACVREASTRVIGLRHFHVQILGGIALHQGRIAEMCTGEGKTLVETLPAYLNALTGKGVHIVTVNGYLAKRDAEWMGQIFKFLGLTVGVITNQQDMSEKKEAYRCDITYGTNSAFGFDYLRDNQVRYAPQMVQRELNYVIIDEVDSVLIDEARTPLIISGKNKKSAEGFYSANSFAKYLKAPDPDADNEVDRMGDFEINEEDRKIVLTERGMEKAQSHFKVENIGDYDNMELYRNIRLAIRANFLMKKDRDYVVKDNQVIIVDEFTGRLQIGRRFNDGLHTAIEAKEGIKIRDENQVVATITYQNLFRLYKKISGMTGTAKTEEEEFKNIYGLDIVVIPTNKPIRRVDENDLIYKTRTAKLRAVVEDIKRCHNVGQPVLVGTVSVEKSEELSNMLYRERIPHNVLNAKNHEREAEIIAQAGKKGAVTIATNMAGRGTDIRLGGNPEFMAKQYLIKAKYSERVIAEATSQVKDSSEEVMKVREIYLAEKARLQEQTDKEKEEVLAVGGLRIIGTERHESRRIDNQLRGRSGRQGDVGSSVFYISFEDDLVRIFAGDRLTSIASTLALPEDTPISMKMITNRIEDAQQRIESRNYSVRKNVLSYDDVMNKQREIIYTDRRKMLYDKTFYQEVYEILKERISSDLSEFDLSVNRSNINIENLNKYLLSMLLQREDFHQYEYRTVITAEDFNGVNMDKLIDDLTERAVKYYNKRRNELIELLDADIYKDAVELSIDLSKPIEEWDYTKLNSIVCNHLPNNLDINNVFELSDAQALVEQNKISVDDIATVINDRLCEIVSSVFSLYDEQIIEAYADHTVRVGYQRHGLDEVKYTSLINEHLDADHHIVLTKQDIEAHSDDLNALLSAELHNQKHEADKALSAKILDKLVEIFTSRLSKDPIEWDFKKVDKDYCSALFVKANNGDAQISGLINRRVLGGMVLDHFSALATERIKKIYYDRLGDAADAILNRLKNKNDTLEGYIKSLLASRADVNESPVKWDYYRLSEVLGFNCLQKADENLASTLISKDDLDSFDASRYIARIKLTTIEAYTDFFKRISFGCDRNVIRIALSNISPKQSIKAYNDMLKVRLLPKELSSSCSFITEEQMGLSLEEKTDIVFNALENELNSLVKSYNSHILEYMLVKLSDSDKSVSEIIDMLSELLPIDCADKLRTINVDGFRVAQSLSIINGLLDERENGEIDRIKTEASSLADRLLKGEKIEQYAGFVEKASLEACVEDATNRLIGVYRSHRDFDSILDDRASAEISKLIRAVVAYTFELQNKPYYEWNIDSVNRELTSSILPPDTGIDLLASYFTRKNVSDTVRDVLVESAYSRIEPIFLEIIDKNRKAGYKSAHDHILKMLPEVVAGVVSENIDFGIDLNDWDFDEINANLRERIVPDIDEEVTLIDQELASNMNIDTVIDAVVDKVVELFDKKAVEYNLDLLESFIMDEVKDYIDRRQSVDEWNYKFLNERLGSLFLAKVDRSKQILDVETVREYLPEGRNSLENAEAVIVIKDSLEKIYLERIDVYNRFVGELCHRKAKPVRTFGDFEKDCLLKYTDEHWFDHIDNMERLRVGIGLRSLGQQNPITCYQSEGFQLFDEMIELIHEDVVIHVLKDDPQDFYGRKEESVSDRFSQKNKKTVYYKRVGAQPIKKNGPKIGPNDPCPCGSGKKYKKCCMNKKGSSGGWNAIVDDDDRK